MHCLESSGIPSTLLVSFFNGFSNRGSIVFCKLLAGFHWSDCRRLDVDVDCYVDRDVVHGTIFLIGVVGLVELLLAFAFELLPFGNTRDSIESGM